jgi:SAM-dependent methyltransferase
VLELGCGTGRITVPVAKAGARIVGLDRSEPMLARAAARLRRGKLTHASLVRGDIRMLPFKPARFALVAAPYGILQSLVRERDLAAALASVHRVLARGARFGIDLVPDLPVWSEYQKKKTLSGTMGGARVSLVESVRQDRRRRLTVFDQRYTATRGRDRRVYEFSLTFRTLSIRAMTARLERAGFAVDAILGDYRGGPWDPRADAWVLLTSKR